MAARGTASGRALRENPLLASGRLTASGRLNVDGSGGNGGADVTNVSSLPAPGAASATTIYHLSTDDRCYILNNAATAMVPIDLPGWPRRDGTDDEEWESVNANPPTGWTWDNQDSTTANENGTRASFLTLTKSNNASSHSLLYKNVPASPNKTYYAALQWASDNDGSGNNCQVGLVLRNNTSGRIVVFVVAGNQIPNFFVVRWTTSTAFNAIAYQSTIQPTCTPSGYLVMAIESDGTNLNFKYAPLHEGGEGNYVQIYTETIAAFLTSFDAFGLTILKNSGTTNRLYCDWIRVV